MPVYTVHAPSRHGDPGPVDKFVFVRDGFHVWAMIFGPFWLLWHRLWLVALGWVIVVPGVEAVLGRLGVARTSILFIDIVVAILLGLEAASLHRWTLSRGKWRQLDLVAADGEDAAERRFFERWVQRHRGLADDHGVDGSGQPPDQSFSNPPPLPSGGILGLFPEPGGTR